MSRPVLVGLGAVLAAAALAVVLVQLRPGEAPPTAVLVGAGDIAGCESRSDDATAALLDTIAGTVFTLGDNSYPDGSAQSFADCYGPTWGRQRARTRPALGNHDYIADHAASYFAYFGSAAGTPGEGWYSYDAGTWHVVVLNAVCGELTGRCGAKSPQLQWLRADLAAHPAKCTLAYWHSPRWSSGVHGDDASVQAFWDALDAAGADVVLNGNDHDYERFAPLDATGRPAANGIREFVAGTGGAGLRPIQSVHPYSEFHRDDVHGLLRLALRDGGYTWSFLAAPSGQVVDQGQGTCR